MYFIFYSCRICFTPFLLQVLAELVWRIPPDMDIVIVGHSGGAPVGLRAASALTNLGYRVCMAVSMMGAPDSRQTPDSRFLLAVLFSLEKDDFFLGADNLQLWRGWTVDHACAHRGGHSPDDWAVGHIDEAIGLLRWRFSRNVRGAGA